MAPSLHDNYLSDSRTWVRIDNSLRIYWHTIFDIAPQLLDLSGPDGQAIFQPFMAWAEERRLSMNWTIYLWIHRWLLQSGFRDRVTPELVRTLVASSAAHWAVMERGPECGIVIGTTVFPEIVVGWKQHTIDGGREIEQLELDEPLPAPPDGAGFFTVRDFEIDRFPGWSPIPR